MYDAMLVETRNSFHGNMATWMEGAVMAMPSSGADRQHGRLFRLHLCFGSG